MSRDFDRLTPQLILEAVEVSGYRTTGEYTQLNSYENRVFDVRLEPTKSTTVDSAIDRVIAKFYRPHRWSPSAIADEHRFLFDLQAEGIPAVAPLHLQNGSTTLGIDGFELALFPRVAGRMPDEFLRGDLCQVGRTLARIHNVGARQPARHRLTLGARDYGWPALERLEQFVDRELWPRYEEAAITIIENVEDELDERDFIRIHGDCHKGNLLHNGSEFFFVDFDDFCNGPVVQDFWMLLSGSIDDAVASEEQDDICKGYEELRELPEQWNLFEPLRGLRIIHYAGWISQRWDDPFFKQIFPTYQTYSYWLDELSRLDKIAANL